MKNNLLCLLMLCCGISNAQTVIDAVYYREQFPSLDSIPITANILQSNPENPWMVLCHQARYSRGEYTQTAPELAKFGYNTIAIDQRSGKEANGVVNQTNLAATTAGKGTDFLDAEQDITAALLFAYTKSKKPVVLVGSSYSAALVLKVAAEHPDKVKAVISFSPGEYFGDQLHLLPFMGKLNMPVWMTSSLEEAPEATKLFDAVQSKQKTQFIPSGKGYHGSRALWRTNKGNEEYWTSLSEFLKALK